MNPVTQTIVTIVVAVFASTGFWTLINNTLSRKSEKKTIQSQILLGLSHDKLYQLCQQYITRGYVTISEYDNLLYLYNPYLKLGGNGTVKKLMEQIDDLPLCNEKEHMSNEIIKKAKDYKLGGD